MQSKHIYLLAAVLVVYTAYTGVTTVALAVTRTPIARRAIVKSPPETDLSNSSTVPRPTPVQYGSAPEIAGSDPTTRGVTDLLSCLVRRWYSNDGQWNECHDALSSFWNSAEGVQDNQIGERKKGWNEQTLMMGAGFKLILLIPFLAILAGKAITLSLISLLITSLAFLHKSHNNLIH